MTTETITKPQVKAVEKPDVEAVEHRRGMWSDFDRFFARGFPMPRRLSRGLFGESWFPDIDVFDRDGAIVLRADLPGMKSEDIQVEVDRDLLTVSGKRHEEKEVKEQNYYHSERSTGEFSRTIRIPEGVAADAVTASYENGILEVIAPKPKGASNGATKIPVK